ncbi:MAG TPA: hypothetical protein VI006_00040 [Solirubrobacteraceae bacterium]
MPRSRPRLVVGIALALAGTAAPAAAAPRPGSYGTHLGSHTMLYLNSTAEAQRALFRASAAAGVRYLRMDFAIGLVFPWGEEDFAAVDRADALAAAYGVEVLGVITTTPWYLAACAGDEAIRCAPAPRYERLWTRMVARVVRRASNVRVWQLGNEPDGFGFVGGASEYARWASLAAAGIRAARPDATVVLGGLARANEPFIAQVLHDPAHPLLGVIDVASVHLRGALSALPTAFASARGMFLRQGFDGPLWVTETGYPSRAEHQWDPAFTRGARDQARWLARGLRSLVHAGAAAVFVTFRDTREFGRASPFASEGVLRWPRLDRDGRARPKPAYWAVRRVAATPCGC